MGSIPVANAGLGSAVNNAISRVGQPLLLAVLFVFISATFYDTHDSAVPGLVDTSEAREVHQPLNPPPSDAREHQVIASRAASTQAFHLAMLATAALFALGALANGLGLHRHAREDDTAGAPDEAEGAKSDEGSAEEVRAA